MASGVKREYEYGSSSDPDDDSHESSRSPSPDVEDAKPQNMFKNDGSFLEMFKKMQEQKGQIDSRGDAAVPTSSAEPSDMKPPAAFVAKRRGRKVLPTGMVKKPKKEGEEVEETTEAKDAWSQYMSEVRKYREKSCEEEGKTRPLVK